ATAFGPMRSISARLAMSQRRAIRPGISLAMAASALSSTSQTKTFAPFAVKARANSRPIPAAPAVIRTRCDMISEPIRPHRQALDNGPDNGPTRASIVWPAAPFIHQGRESAKILGGDSGLPMVCQGGLATRAGLY